MDEDLTTHDGSSKTCNTSLTEDEANRVKDFVYKHFRQVTEGSTFCNPGESSIKELGNSTKKDKFSLSKAQGAVFSGKILSFGCSVCKDDSTYSPNDLLKHFQAAHEGTLPTYPCELCGFVTNEFPALQRHRIEHRNTLVTCELCNDDVQYSLLLLTRHYIMCHSLNGQFNCEWCEFTTVDAGTFVQHIHHHNESPWKCSKCRQVNLNEEDHQRHMKAHLGTFPFTCHICGYGAATKEHLKKHLAIVHKEEREEREKAVEDSCTSANSPAGLQLLRKNCGESQAPARMSKQNCLLSGSLSTQNPRLIKPEISFEETQYFVDGTVVKRDKNWSKGFHSKEQPQESGGSATSDAPCHTNPNGLTVLMVKNKISLPPNCTTKVMGFKVVDGKKHLVLKVIPTAKQDLSIQNHSSLQDVSSAAISSVLDKSEVTIRNGECCDSKSATLHCFAVSPRESACLPMDQDDILAVKVKVEEEETTVCNLYSNPHGDSAGAETPLLNKSSERVETFYHIPNDFDNVGLPNHPVPSTPAERRNVDIKSTFSSTSYSDSKITTSTVFTCMASGLSSASKFAQDTLVSEQISQKCVENCSTADVLSINDKIVDRVNDKHTGNPFSPQIDRDDQCSLSTPEKNDNDRKTAAMRIRNGLQNFEKVFVDRLSVKESSPHTSSNCRETGIASESCTQNVLNQKVFAFHNYSKEKLSNLPDITQNIDNMNLCSTDRKSICETSQISLTLAGSPEQLMESAITDKLIQKKYCEDSETVPNNNIKVEEHIINDPTEDGNPESVLQDYNIIKIEEESIPIAPKLVEINSSTSMGSFVEKHSDAIITQQLNKDRTGPSGASSDSLRQAKTTLRILQLPEVKQPMLLKNTENQFSMPLQVKASPGFKLITNSGNPQINVSYMKPRLETVSSPVPNTSNPRIGVLETKAKTAEKGAAFLSSIQPGAGIMPNQYLINSRDFKGPVLLSSTPHIAPTDKQTKTQPTCYVVQRSVPLVQTSSAPGLKLTSTQLPPNSQPALAMPMSSTDKPSNLQTSRQAFLLRYISPFKSGQLLNKGDTKFGAQYVQNNESTGNKVILKIVTPAINHCTSGTPTSNTQPLFLATRPQTQCFLLSSNKTNVNASTKVKKLITIQNTSQKDLKESFIPTSQLNFNLPLCDVGKSCLAPRPFRPPSQRKRSKKQLFDELPETLHKVRKLANKALTEKDSTVLWKPVAKEVERTLRLVPFSSPQQVRCPRRYQPVVVLNHPDADIPEVANIMKVVNKYRGAVTKVSLSQKTVQALSQLGNLKNMSLATGLSSRSDDLRPRPVWSSVRERFLLKLKLRKKSKKRYEVVETFSRYRQEPLVFECWFCGRLFNNQEDWIGHGQRHLMEATRDWNKLF
ncbi:uncharacterized protein V6R79_002279 [Siganus canaliculatus]